MLYIGNNQVFWKTISTYSKLRRNLCDSFYCLKEPIEESDEYEDFVRAANYIFEMAAPPEEYVAVQFQGADMYHYPVPRDLSHPIAEKRWRLFVANKNVENHVRQQEIYLSKLLDKGLSKKEAVLSEKTPFAAWFRLLFIDTPSDELIREGLEEVRNPRLLEQILERGYDTKNIMRWRNKEIVV